MPLVEIPATELLSGNMEKYSGKLVKIVFKESDMFQPVDSNSDFDLNDYFSHPEKYQSKFNPYIAQMDILVNCIYWDTPCPRLITLDEIRTHYRGTPRLLVVGDITCDIDGSIQFNTGATLSPEPVYVYHPETHERSMGFEGEGPLVMAVDNLPTELPREASEAFGSVLIPFVPQMGACDYRKSFADLDLPPEVKRAVITHQGFLTPEFQYLTKYLKA